VGTILFTAGLIWFARAPLDGHFLIDIMPPMFLLGLGAGLTLACGGSISTGLQSKQVLITTCRVAKFSRRGYAG
jgi:hypothetical protein